MANAENLKPFRKGDIRINRKGRPKSFEALRALAQSISHEIVVDTTDGKELTTAETILRQWASSSNPQLQMKFVEVAFGKVPDEVQVSGKDGQEAIVVALMQPGQAKRLT